MIMHAVVDKGTQAIAPSGESFHIYATREAAHTMCAKVNLVYGESTHEVKQVILATPL